MRRHVSFLVVAGWGGLNAVLLSVLAVYGENSLVFWLWGGVVALLELLASSRCSPPRARAPRNR
ncbi:hypothetical protein ABZ281_28595 [Streptomyces sp. NPDC006265]|uniref:hypothetical protein n=1 Tax=Streptomyces sp. NPDC006265 TaxID=3156740 RepID=UPI0033A160DF